MVKKCLLIVCCTLAIRSCHSSLPKRITLGGLFNQDDPSEGVFRPYVQVVNNMRYRDPQQAQVFFDTDAINITDDPFDVSQIACSLLETGVAAIFGPSEKDTAGFVQNMCEPLGLPNIVWRRDVAPIKGKSFNLYPNLDELSMMFIRLVSEYNWKGFTIVYEKTENLILLNGLLQKYNTFGPTVTIRHLGRGPNYRETMIEIRKSKETNIIIACSYKILEEVLMQSLQSGILSEKHEVIVTNLDLQTIDLDPYKYSGVNLTGFRLVDVRSDYARDLFAYHLQDLGGVADLSEMRVAQALTYDALQFFSRSLGDASSDRYTYYAPSLLCDSSDAWNYGISLENYLRTTEIRGLTGLVKFHTNGFRSEFELDVVRLNQTGLITAGTYNTTTGFDWFYDEEPHEKLQNLSFKILIAMNKPYNMLTNSSIRQTGNDRYEGFAIDIIKKLAEHLHFNYTFIVHNGGYGSKGANGKWSGMLGDIIEGKADLAITDLTITAERQSAVDFTTPFMSLGINILYKKPSGAAPSLFSFLAPFSNAVYYYLAAAYISVSLCLFALGRMCPAEWNCPYPCIEEPEVLENQFTLKNALWFTLGSIMQQGSEIAPIGLSTRMLAAAWWFFCLIMVASYTANIAALLVVETIVIPFKDAEELAGKEGRIKYGAKKDGATLNFFNVSDEKVHKTMFAYMIKNKDDVLTESNEEGRDRVIAENGGYAFLMESTTIDYIAQRYCGLSKVSQDNLDSKGYGIAMRKNSWYRREFNHVILKLQEDGTLKDLEEKWWQEMYNDEKCSKVTQSTISSAMTLDHVGGVFLVLGIGVALAVLFTVWEFIWDICSTTSAERISFKEEFAKEMRFVLKCKGHVKAARRRGTSTETLGRTSRDQSSPPYGSIPTVMTTSLEN